MVVFYLGASVPTSYTTSVDANQAGLMVHLATGMQEYLAWSLARFTAQGVIP